MGWVLHLLLTVNIFVISILIHEFGHLAYFRMIDNKTANIVFVINKGLLQVGHDKDYWVLSPERKNHLYLSGVIPGLVFLFMTGFYYTPSWFLLIPYIWGSRKDLINIYNNFADYGVNE